MLTERLRKAHETLDSEITRLRAEFDALKSLSERLKLEAQIHAQEARTANATIAECYQVVTGGKGEPGRWHGAAPVRECIEALRADAERYRWLKAQAFYEDERDMGPGRYWRIAFYRPQHEPLKEIDAVIDAARAAQGGGEHGR